MYPLPSLSNTLNASRSSSSESVSCTASGAGGFQLWGLARASTAHGAWRTFILRAIRFRNSGKSMVPLPSASTWACDRPQWAMHQPQWHSRPPAGAARTPRPAAGRPSASRRVCGAQGAHLVDHVLQLRLRRVLAQRPHHCAQLLGRHGACDQQPGSGTARGAKAAAGAGRHAGGAQSQAGLVPCCNDRAARARQRAVSTTHRRHPCRRGRTPP